MRSRLNELDKKFIRHQMRAGRMLAAFIFFAGGFYNVFYFAIPSFQISNRYILIVDVMVVLLGVFTWNRINRKYRLDLEADVKIVKKAKVQKKESFTSYESGSGSLYIPILGDLFPKLFNLKMKPTGRYYLIINNTRMRFDEASYNSVKEGDEVEVYYTSVSDIRIGIDQNSISVGN
ncbi:MAG: hypothetical protein KAG64_05565 [Bacteroidales bacterium]|nr:hypothetical protein [Bacteroidales bacterium]